RGAGRKTAVPTAGPQRVGRAMPCHAGSRARSALSAYRVLIGLHWHAGGWRQGDTGTRRQGERKLSGSLFFASDDIYIRRAPPRHATRSVRARGAAVGEN